MSFRFMTFEGRKNGERFIEFLKRLIYKQSKPVFLILDGHPVHKSKVELVEESQTRTCIGIES
ncbi:MAG TPA: hypothetical protein ENI98_08595 [Gammaproteobacteria bacterium]|nr:hypothetical protein [Gammaproteobacteria bacterium]